MSVFGGKAELTRAAAGGTAGYNWQMDHFVISVEGDWSWVGQNGSAVDTGPAGNPAFSSFTKERWLATVRGRAGYAADSVLFYVTGGYARPPASTRA